MKDYFNNFRDLIDLAKNFFIMVGGAIALFNYISQNRQKGIDNSRSLLNSFERSIKEEDLEIWKMVFFNTYESTGAMPGNFIVYTKDNESASELRERCDRFPPNS